jgi:hypothetical protein
MCITFCVHLDYQTLFFLSTFLVKQLLYNISLGLDEEIFLFKILSGFHRSVFLKTNYPQKIQITCRNWSRCCWKKIVQHRYLTWNIITNTHILLLLDRTTAIILVLFCKLRNLIRTLLLLFLIKRKTNLLLTLICS